MSDLASVLLLLVLLLALLGALRYDTFGLIWREWLKLGRPAEPPSFDETGAHGPYVPASPRRPGHEQPGQKPAYHRSGRRT